MLLTSYICIYSCDYILLYQELHFQHSAISLVRQQEDKHPKTRKKNIIIMNLLFVIVVVVIVVIVVVVFVIVIIFRFMLILVFSLVLVLVSVLVLVLILLERMVVAD